MKINLLRIFLPGRPTAELLASMRVGLEAERRASHLKDVLYWQDQALQDARERIARQGRILAAEIRDHEATKRLLAAAEDVRDGAVACLTAATDRHVNYVNRVLTLEGEIERLETENQNLTRSVITHAETLAGQRYALKAAKTKRRNR